MESAIKVRIRSSSELGQYILEVPMNTNLLSLASAICVKEGLKVEQSLLSKVVQLKSGFPPKVQDLNSEMAVKNNDNFIVELSLEPLADQI